MGKITKQELNSVLVQELQANQDHILDTNNPHEVTKGQVGLGSVENYGIATQEEATDGTVTNKYMTPLRTMQAIDLKTKAFYNSNVLPSNLPSDFAEGYHCAVFPIISTEGAPYLAWRDEIASALGLPVSSFAFVIVLETLSRGAIGSGLQRLSTYSNNNSSIGKKLFTLERSSTSSTGNSNVWRDWDVDVYGLSGTGNPEGTVFAFKGQMYTNIENGDIYFKSQGTNTITNIGWIKKT